MTGVKRLSDEYSFGRFVSDEDAEYDSEGFWGWIILGVLAQ